MAADRSRWSARAAPMRDGVGRPALPASSDASSPRAGRPLPARALPQKIACPARWTFAATPFRAVYALALSALRSRSAVLVRFWLGPLPFAVLAAACAGASTETPGAESPRETKNGDTVIRWSQGEEKPFAPGSSIDTSDLEIRHDNIDRFAHCPPSGDLGQGWIP